jgi:hypothetical protein
MSTVEWRGRQEETIEIKRSIVIEGNKKIIPVAMFVEVYSLPFQITDVEDYFSHYVNHLRNHASLSEPAGVTLTTLAGNLAHNFTASVKIGQDEYRASFCRSVLLLHEVRFDGDR